MSKLTNAFLDFLFERHKLTGKYSFTYTDYMDFDGYEEAIIELSNRGVVEKINDILGTIVVRPPED